MLQSISSVIKLMLFC